VEFKEKNPSKLTEEVVDKPASRPNIFLENPSISAEILSSSWKAERERERVSSVQNSLQCLLVAPLAPRQTAVRGKIHVAPPAVPCRCYFFLCGKKKGHRRTEVAL
jgi:hypothetical protein